MGIQILDAETALEGLFAMVRLLPGWSLTPQFFPIRTTLMRHLQLPVMLAVALTALNPTALADNVTGRVVDSMGVGIAGVDLDVQNLGGGGDPTPLNDGTDALGFFDMTVPAGLYLITFNPPAPPASTSLVLEVDNVVILGVTAMGDVMLPQGVALTGRTTNSSGLPVAGVNLDLIDLDTGDDLTLVGGSTDLFGNFSIAAPFGDVELRMDTTPVAGPLLAPHAISVTLTSSTNLGDVVLQPGLLVSATVVGPGGVPVDNADVDVIDLASGEQRYTPGDNSDSSGFVDFVVPAGFYDFEICPRFADRLVGHTVSDAVVSGPLNLGVLPLQAGFIFAGTVTSHTGATVQGVDVDVRNALGQSVTLCGDNTNGNGDYAVLVPAGTWNVNFSPSFVLPLGSSTQMGVSVVADTALNSILAACPFATSAGGGAAGTAGFVPELTSSGGTLRLGNPNWTVELTRGLGGSLAYLTVSAGAASPLGPTPTPIPGIWGWNANFRVVHLPQPLVLSGAPGQAGVGAASRMFPLPGDPVLAGMTLRVNARVVDPMGPGGFSRSNTLGGILCE